MRKITLSDLTVKETAGDLRHAANVIEAALAGITPRSTAERFVDGLRDRADALDEATRGTE